MYINRAIVTLLLLNSMRIVADSKSGGNNCVLFIYRDPFIFKPSSVTISVDEIDIVTLGNGQYYRTVHPSGQLTIKVRRKETDESSAISLITKPLKIYYLRIRCNSRHGILLKIIPAFNATAAIAHCKLVSELQIDEFSRELDNDKRLLEDNKRIRRRGFEFQLCIGIPFNANYQGELKAVLDQAKSLGYYFGMDSPDFLIEMGWAIAKDLYLAFTINGFGTTYAKFWMVQLWPLGIWLPALDSLTLETTLFGFSVNYYPFHESLLIKIFVGIASVSQYSEILEVDKLQEGLGTAITIAYDMNPRIPAFAFIIGLKGCLVLLPNSTISTVAPFIGIAYR